MAKFKFLLIIGLVAFIQIGANAQTKNTSKRVEPLYWLNPNNYAYSELNAPKHMKMPKVVLPDADKDGITDQFDLEPNTPAGAAVDNHGVAKDTDGDGVPDYKDKELLTSQKCFPVNADGIGNCPEPACCTELRTAIANIKVAPAAPVCAIASLPSVQFKKGAALTKDAETVLASAAAQIKANPDCKVKVIGYVGTATASKAAQQLSYDRVSAVIKYLVEKQGISESRLLFFYGENGDANTVDLQGTTEDGPNTVPAPHPNLRSK
jgi:OOP family OmpA-OmpF porin